jgi:hypothetical protein
MDIGMYVCTCIEILHKYDDYDWTRMQLVDEEAYLAVKRSVVQLDGDRSENKVYPC